MLNGAFIENKVHSSRVRRELAIAIYTPIHSATAIGIKQISQRTIGISKQQDYIVVGNSPNTSLTQTQDDSRSSHPQN